MRAKYKTYARSVLVELRAYKKDNNRSHFKEAFMKLMPDVRAYISKNLNIAERKGVIAKGSYQADDFINDLYLYTYEHIDNVSEETDFHSWLYEQADELLNDTFIYESLEESNMEDLEALSESEWQLLEERFTQDTDGDLIMMDELDDPSYPKVNYGVADFFAEDQEKELIERLDEEISEERLHNHVSIVLEKLPVSMHSIFDLKTVRGFELKDIAKIKRMHLSQVNEILQEAQNQIRKSIDSRFLK
ncbi:sigma-70 family RNA polymerase sigma factor [Flagellimonas sp. SN16]|uniref:sigma-70 family RNA polymerase sigma factor n=1 Tax=Flagellimonas sp. SN16 TaxID=3415142 RepID=UPI003C5A277D